MTRQIVIFTIDTFYLITRNLIGTIQHPYITWKRVIRDSNWSSSIALLIIISTYFAVREPIRWGNLKISGLVIERVTIEKLTFWAQISSARFISAVFSYIFIVFLTTVIAHLVAGLNFKYFISSFKHTAVVWVYSYLPTVLWFLIVAGLFVVLPPPRYQTWMGFLFSAVFLAISAGLLIWKILLYYLTLRLALKLVPSQIFWVFIINFPFVVLFSKLMYNLEVFKIPFV